VSFVFDRPSSIAVVSFIPLCFALAKRVVSKMTLASSAAHPRSNVAMRKASPVAIIAETIRASLLASATLTSRAGLFARSPTRQSRKVAAWQRLAAKNSDRIIDLAA
jgi:hypothetical protein